MWKAARFIAPTLLTLLIPTPGLHAQANGRLRVSGDSIKSYIAYLAADELQGRQTMTPSYQKAAEWVADRYRAWGLEPAGDNGTYFQRVPIARGLTVNNGVPELAVNGEPFSLLEGDFTLNSASTVATTVNAQVVFAGYGISAPAKGLDEYAGLDVRGKVVLVLTGSPTAAPAIGGRGSMAPAPRAGPEPQEAWTQESTTPAKMRTAFEKGAAAILFYNPDAAASGGAGFGGARRGQQESFAPTRDFLAFTITDRAFHAIMMPDPQESVRGFTTRLTTLRDDIKYGTPRSAATEATVHLKGYDSTDVYSEELGNNFAYNVLAKLPGTDSHYRGEFVVIGGHLDHLGMRDGQVYNGADDDASGAAAAMDVARVMKQGGFRPARTIIFAAWCGEELGLIGSNYFVSDPPEGVDIDKVVADFNMDMVGLGDAIGAPGALNFPTIWEVIKRDQDPDVMAAVQPRTGGPGGSDFSAFIVRGIESLALMTSGGVGHPYYHRPEDDTDKIDPEILRKTGQLVLQGAMNVANEKQVQLLIPNRENLYNAVMLNIQSFNPGQGQFQEVPLGVHSRAELVKLVLDSALAVNARLRDQARAPQAAPAAGMRNRGGAAAQGGKSFNRGISDLAPFEGDTDLLLAAAELVGFGRLDVEGSDGVWVAGGHLTDRGREALGAMEANGIALHLASPSAALLSEVLAAATRPFIVSGSYEVTPAMAAAINEKGVILAVPMDPANVGRTIARLEELKALLGDTDNFVLSVTSEAGMDQAKTALYLGLLDKGWTPAEIAGDRRAGGGIAGAALSAFSGGGAMQFGR